MAAEIDITDVLIKLLRQQQRGVFHFMMEADPYINRAEAALRRPLQRMIAESRRQEEELLTLLSEIGAMPPPAPVNPENQYLAFLTIDFLLPKLKEDKQRAVMAYERAISQIGAVAPQVTEVLRAHLHEHMADLELLSRATVQEAEGKVVSGH